MEKKEVNELKALSAKMRVEVLKTLKHRTYGHVGGSMSIIETLSTLYGKHLKHDPLHPDWEDRDYLVLSKGHAGPGLYAALAVRGYFDKEVLHSLNEGGANLPSHPDRILTRGIDATTGSLGQGTSVAAGLGYALKLEQSNQFVYLIVGDGELNEGQCWEAFQFIAHNKLNNVIVMIDENKRQLDGFTVDIMNPFDIQEKMRAFGFYTLKVNGGSELEISNAIDQAKAIEDQAVCIVLDTVKGQGVPYFEEMADNHSVKFSEKDNQAVDHAISKLQELIQKAGAQVCGN